MQLDTLKTTRARGTSQATATRAETPGAFGQYREKSPQSAGWKFTTTTTTILSGPQKISNPLQIWPSLVNISEFYNTEKRFLFTYLHFTDGLHKSQKQLDFQPALAKDQRNITLLVKIGVRQTEAFSRRFYFSRKS